MVVQQPRHSEPSANSELGDILRTMLFGCQVRSENTQLIEGHAGLQLDNLITADDRAPVVVEAEYEAVGTAEADASARLGLSVVGEVHPIEAAIALRYPDSVRFGDNLHDALAAARLSYAVLYQDGGRFPESGWLEAGLLTWPTSSAWYPFRNGRLTRPARYLSKASSAGWRCSTIWTGSAPT